MASDAAVRAFRERSYDSPVGMVRGLHAALAGSRGAALAVADVNRARRSVTFCGIGNITGCIVEDDGRRGMVSLPGIVGHHVRRIDGFRYDLGPRSRVVLHSDGLTDKWTPFPALTRRDPRLAAAALLREAGVRNDDASVTVVETMCTS
jgi:hypothetical protein